MTTGGVGVLVTVSLRYARPAPLVELFFASKLYFGISDAAEKQLFERLERRGGAAISRVHFAVKTGQQNWNFPTFSRSSDFPILGKCVLPDGDRHAVGGGYKMGGGH